MDEVYEILEYLPISDVEVNDYVSPLFNSAIVTYEKEEYQFSYFAIHLIFMTYIYLTVWKISQFHKDKYEHSLLFARPYNGKEVDFKEIKTIFDFSHLPEKDIFEFFALIGVDNGYIKSTKKLIDYRNDMAHATGKIQIYSEEKFNIAITEVLSVTKKIHEKLTLTIRAWYNEELRNYAKNGLPENYSTPSDYITEGFIKNLSFSKKDLEVCKDFGLNKLKNRKESGLSKEEIEKIVEFHESVKEQYNNLIGDE
jgi:hypothetical protein